MKKSSTEEKKYRSEFGQSDKIHRVLRTLSYHWKVEILKRKSIELDKPQWFEKINKMSERFISWNVCNGSTKMLGAEIDFDPLQWKLFVLVINEERDVWLHSFDQFHHCIEKVRAILKQRPTRCKILIDFYWITRGKTFSLDIKSYLIVQIVSSPSLLCCPRIWDGEFSLHDEKSNFLTQECELWRRDGPVSEALMLKIVNRQLILNIPISIRILAERKIRHAFPDLLGHLCTPEQ